jgi:hypothetical protein
MTVRRLNDDVLGQLNVVIRFLVASPSTAQQTKYYYFELHLKKVCQWSNGMSIENGIGFSHTTLSRIVVFHFKNTSTRQTRRKLLEVIYKTIDM